MQKTNTPAAAAVSSLLPRSAHRQLMLHQPSQPCTEGFHPIHDQKQQNQDHPNLAVLPPGDLLIEKQPDPPCPYVAQDGTVAYIALQQIEHIGEIGRCDFRENGMDKGPNRTGSHGLQGRIGPQRCTLHVLIGQPGHNGKGIDRDRGSSGKGTDPQKEGGQQGQDQSRKRPQQLDTKAQEFFDSPRPGQCCGTAHGGWNGQYRSQDRTGNGHLHSGPEQRQDFPCKAPLRREHLRHDVHQMALPGPQHGKVTACEPGSSQKGRRKGRGCQRPGKAPPHTPTPVPP